MSESHTLKLRRELKEVNDKLDVLTAMLAPLIVRLAQLEQENFDHGRQ